MSCAFRCIIKYAVAALLLSPAPALAFWSGPCMSFGPGGFGFHMPFSGFGGPMNYGAPYGPGPGPGPYPSLYRQFMPMSIPPAPPRQPVPKAEIPPPIR